mgnify:FL=1|tara:strand:+ start:327 stop:1094 length:768 start_codon:yes stop_codon:yes gene_type:complete
MAFNSKLILPKYIQARQALMDYSLKMLDSLGTGNKSRSKIRKFNVMSMWIDYIGNSLSAASSKSAVSPSAISVDILEVGVSQFEKVVLSIETAAGKLIPLCISRPLHEYIGATGGAAYDFTYRINRSADYPDIRTHNITATYTGGIIKVSLPKGALFNNAVVVAHPNLITLQSSTAVGGVDAVSASVLHSDDTQDKIIKLLDILAIELDIVYKTDKQILTDSLIDRSRIVERRDSRISLDGKNSLSDEHNRNLEL